MSFQTQVNIQQAPGLPGDFASSNPRASVDAGQGALIAGTAGVTIGLFAWMDSQQLTVANTGTGAPTGFVHREQQGLTTAYLAEYGGLIPSGFMVTLMKSGDYFVKNAGSGAVTVGQKVFVNNATGQVSTAAAGSTVSGSTETKWFAESACAAGEVFKMTATPVG